MSDIEQMSYTEIMPRVGELADELLNHPDEDVRGQIEELLDWVDIFHREGLQRVVDLIRAWRGDLFLEQVEADEIVGPFLSAYDLTETYEDGEAPVANGADEAAEGFGNGDLS
jgi:hypothetical protein